MIGVFLAEEIIRAASLDYFMSFDYGVCVTTSFLRPVSMLVPTKSRLIVGVLCESAEA